MKQTKCHEPGKHEGEVLRRRVIDYGGLRCRRYHSFSVCDRHYKINLRQMIKRGKVAAEVLAELESK